MSAAYDICAPDDPEMIEMFCRELGIAKVPDSATFLAFRNSQGIQGGWMFERYTGPGGSVCAHWAADQKRRWLVLDKMVMCALYVYVQLGVNTVFGEVPAKDTEVRKIDEKMGFRQAALIPGYFPDDDLVIYRLDKQDCKWLPAEFKKEASDG